MRRLAFPLLTCLALTPLARAADTIPGAALEPAEKAAEDNKDGDGTITILGRRWYEDAEIVGPYGQPAWTTAKRFAKTRVYVLPPGSAAFEYWLESKGELESDASAKFRSNYELEIGLGAHLQLDLYIFTEQGEGYAPLKLAGEQIELRWATADWGVLWGNPTLYLEWIRRHEAPQRLEGKILLGDAIGPRLFWGFNLIYERELGGAAMQEYAASGGLSWSVVDGVFSLGIEAKVEMEDLQGSRFDFEEVEFLLGPTAQIRPLPGLHVDLIPMFGLELENGEAEPIYAVFLMLGKDFGSWLPGREERMPEIKHVENTEGESQIEKLPAAPWSLRYHDGSNNGYLIQQEKADGLITFRYEPVQPAESSSGTYSGGEPRQVALSHAQAGSLWSRALALSRNTDLHAEARRMGSGLFGLEFAGETLRFILPSRSELSDWERVLATLVKK